MKRLKELKKWIYKQLAKITPGKTAVTGGATALIIVSSLLFVIAAIYSAESANDPWILSSFLMLVLVVVLYTFISLWIIKKIHTTPRKLKIALFISIPLLLISLALEPLYLIAALIVISFLGAAIAIFAKGAFKNLTKTKKTVTILGVVIGIAGLVGAIIAYVPTGFKMKPSLNAASLNSASIENINAPSPAATGVYRVQKLTYGSGKDKHRREFGEEVTIKTDSVNGVPFIDNWEGLGGWYRTKYWGFDAKALPVNGYVWYPEGDGPFPLALIVHGNHLMSDYSDVGYEYLGELLASRGIITVSVDENFLNASWADVPEGLDEENDARGWMLLEHLKVWHEWNDDEDNQFYHKVDTSNLALLGHSRGGEAVGHAAFLNKLPFYSDDASIPLDYNYNIKSIVAIAPVDRQYEPGNSPNELKDVSYFTLHGSQDGDVTSFAGSKQYERISFSDSTAHFKSGLYIKGANHGQFNTSWGDNDAGNAATRFLNNAQLLSEEDQREIAKVYISAFLETTLKQNEVYRPLFTDARKGKDWLPETIYLNQYEDASFEPLATFDEDFNVLTTNNSLASISSENLTVWKEQEIDLKWGEKGSRAAYIGWHYKDTEEGEMIPDSIVASYTISFQNTTTLDALSKAFAKADSTSTLTFSLAESTENSDPKSSGKWVEEDEIEVEVELEDDDKNKVMDEDDDDKLKIDLPENPIDFTLQLEDSYGSKATFCLSDFSALQREIEVRIWKSQFITDDSASETVFQTFVFPMHWVKEKNPNFDVNTITNIQFIFDKTPEGVIVLDNLGFMRNL